MVSHHPDDIPSSHGSETRIGKTNPPGRVARCDRVGIRRAGQSHAMRHTAQQGATRRNKKRQVRVSPAPNKPTGITAVWRNRVNDRMWRARRQVRQASDDTASGSADQGERSSGE